MHRPGARRRHEVGTRSWNARRLQGVRHNRDFLVATLREPAFLAGDTTTDFIERVDQRRDRKRELSRPPNLADAVTRPP